MASRNFLTWPARATAPIGVAAMFAVAGAAWAQQADNDYYAARGTALLNTVQKYHLFRAEDEIRSRNYTPARADLDFLLHYFPNHPQGLLLVVQLCTEHSAQNCALDVIFDNAIAVNPKNPGTFVTRGVYLHRVKRYNEAIKSYEDALALDPNSMGAHYNLGLAYLETKQYDLANQHAQLAYGLGAPLPGLRNRLQQSGHWKAAASP